jgi:hypothetical protein
MADKIVQTFDNGLATREPVPEYLQRGGRGMEDATAEDITMPRIAIAQTNTPQAKKADALYIKGLEEGMLFNTVTNEIYGDKVLVIPLFLFKQRMKFGEYGSGEGILCQSLNGIDGGRLHPSDCKTCEFSQFKPGADDIRPDCDTLYNYMCVLPDKTWGVVSCRSTNIKAAKQFNAKVRISRLDMFARVVQVSSIGKTAKNNSFYGIVLEQKGYVPQDVYQIMEGMFAELRGKTINVDTKGMDDEGASFNAAEM